MNYRVNVVFSKDDDGYYAWCPELTGCQTQGDTYEEARANIQEAIELYLETMTPDEVQDALGKEILTTTVEVAIA